MRRSQRCVVAGRAPASNPLVLPQLVTDPIWSLRPWPVVVEFQGRSLEIPALPAADWLQVLMSDQGLYGIFPGLLRERDVDWVEERLFYDDLNVQALENLQLDVLSQVAGRPWYVAQKLVAVARGAWDTIGAELVMQADASRLSIAGWLDVLYLVILRAMDENKKQLFVSELGIPPVGYATEDPQEMEMSESAFLALGQ